MRDVRIDPPIMIHDTQDELGSDASERVHENSMKEIYTSASAAARGMVGQLIDGRYRVDEVLRDGAMGTIFRATQISVDRTVALKVMSMRHVTGAGNIDRFLQEAKIISELTHPNIVRLFDFGKDDEHDVLFVVMEFLHGVSLADMLTGHRLQADLAIELLYQACGALTEPHNLDVIHRDLKPENILLVPLPDGSVQLKVVDFGVARALETDKRVTAQGMIFGTPAYMAPEQAQEGDVDARTDLYALGVILYEMLSGRVPFDARTSIQVVLKQIQEAHPALEDVLGDAAPPAGVLDLVDDLLEKNPAERPQTALQLRMELEELMDEYRFKRIRVGTEGPLLERFSRWLEPRTQTSPAPVAEPAHEVEDAESATVKTLPMAPLVPEEVTDDSKTEPPDAIESAPEAEAAPEEGEADASEASAPEYEPKPTLLQFSPPPALTRPAERAKTKPLTPAVPMHLEPPRDLAPETPEPELEAQPVVEPEDSGESERPTLLFGGAAPELPSESAPSSASLAPGRPITKPLGLVEPSKAKLEEATDTEDEDRKGPISGMSMTSSETLDDAAPEPRPKVDRVDPSPSLRLEAEHLQAAADMAEEASAKKQEKDGEPFMNIDAFERELSKPAEDTPPEQPKAERRRPEPSGERYAREVEAVRDIDVPKRNTMDFERDFFSASAEELGSGESEHPFLDEADMPPSSRNIVLPLVMLGVFLLAGAFIGVLVMSDLGREEVESGVASASTKKSEAPAPPKETKPAAAKMDTAPDGASGAASDGKPEEASAASSEPTKPSPEGSAAAPAKKANEDDSVSRRRRAARRKRRAEKRRAEAKAGNPIYAPKTTRPEKFGDPVGPPRTVGDAMPPRTIDSSAKKKPKKKPSNDKLQENLDWLKQR